MAQIFPRSANTLARASLLGALLLAVVTTGAFAVLDRSPYVTREGIVRAQPIPFSHAHHVGGLGLDCRFCHSSVETSSFAGIPPTETCMVCHAQVWSDSPTLAGVRESLARDEPLRWARVHDLPDFVHFDHSVHVVAGVDCTACHGDVARMPLVRRVETLKMEWCLGCHRDPTAALPDDAAVPAAARTSCSACHQ